MFAVVAVVKQADFGRKGVDLMTEKGKSVPGVALRRKGDPPVTEPEIVDAEVVETENVEKEERQGSRRPETWETDFLQESRGRINE